VCPFDPADVRKVVVEEPAGRARTLSDDPVVQKARG
jgi:hypothetical protein